MGIKNKFHITIITFGIIISVFFCYRIKDYLTNIFIDINDTCADLSNAGVIGDFFGGFIGTLFAIISVYLLYSTLVSQRQESNENREVLILQQFDNVFFELLNLHKQNVENFETVDYSGNIIKGGKFFIYQREELKKFFVPQTSINRNRKEAIKAFEILYTIHYETFAVYFRTLYQLYNLIIKEPLTQEQKIKYAKILRAQLNNGELFFIRYNAMTEIGSNSVNFINEFHLLKHLSSFELLEFQFWSCRMNDYEKKGLSNIFKDLKHILKNIIQDDTPKLEKIYKHGKYKFTVISRNRYEAYVSIIIDSSKNPLGQFNANGLCYFDISQIHNLLKSAVKEFIIYSNYNKFNTAKNLEFKTLSLSNGVILIKIFNKSQEPLLLQPKELVNSISLYDKSKEYFNKIAKRKVILLLYLFISLLIINIIIA